MCLVMVINLFPASNQNNLLLKWANLWHRFLYPHWLRGLVRVQAGRGCQVWCKLRCIEAACILHILEAYILTDVKVSIFTHENLHTNSRVKSDHLTLVSQLGNTARNLCMDADQYPVNNTFTAMILMCHWYWHKYFRLPKITFQTVHNMLQC